MANRAGTSPSIELIVTWNKTIPLKNKERFIYKRVVRTLPLSFLA